MRTGWLTAPMNRMNELENEQWLTAPMAKDLEVSGRDVVKPVAVSPVTKLSKVGGQLFLPWLLPKRRSCGLAKFN